MRVQLYFCRYCGNVIASGVNEDHLDGPFCRVCNVTAPHVRIDIQAHFDVPADRAARSNQESE